MTDAKEVRLVVFDCDGTLVDSQHLIVQAMAGAFEAQGLPPPEAGAVCRVVGLSLGDAVSALLPPSNGAEAAAVSEHYRRIFAELRRGPHHEPLYPGTLAALSELESAGYLLGVATGKSLRGLEAVLSNHGLEDRFVTLQTADRGPGKPHPEMLHRAMAEAGAAAEGTALVGDTSFDMVMAREAGVGAIGVAWGYHEPVELWAAGAHGVIRTFDELPPLVEALTKSRTWG